MSEPGSRLAAADELREEAAACRRLATRARTEAGNAALSDLADQFDTDARRVDPHSERR